MTMKEVIQQQNNLLQPPKVNDIVEGEIIGTGRSAVYLDLGPFGTGVIYGQEFYRSKGRLKELEVGDKIPAKVVSLENEEGFVELSLKKATREIAWRKLRQFKKEGKILEVKISGANKGGLLTRVNGIQGFIPVSQLTSEHYPRVKDGDPEKIVQELKKFVDQTLEVKILDISPPDKLILSEKAKLAQKKREILKEYQKGDTIKGEITGIANFGAFIQFSPSSKAPNLEGLIHISELSWELIDDPSQVVKVGQKIKAKIINIKGDRVFLSLKALQKDPWKGIQEKVSPGDTVKGKVIKLEDFGALVQVGIGSQKPKNSKIRGLCHVSEFGTQRKMRKKLELGEQYQFEILSLQPRNHKMTLQLV